MSRPEFRGERCGKLREIAVGRLGQSHAKGEAKAQSIAMTLMRNI